MAIIIHSQELDKYRFTREQQLWVYNGFDTCITQEIFKELSPLLKPDTTGLIYNFEKAQLGPALSMMHLGLRLDQQAVEKKLIHFKKLSAAVARLWDRIVAKSTDKKINWASPEQLKEYFYGALDIQPVMVSFRGQRRVSINEEVLEHLKSTYPRASLPARVVLRLRELKKTIEVLEKRLDRDYRMRCSYNVSGTETGRWSSSKSAFNTGTNLQNITPSLRSIFIPDEGRIFVNVDLMQAESRAVGYLSGDEDYIKACESGDLHTFVACMIFNIAPERVNETYYRHFSYRYMAKRAGHGTNYMLSPHSLGRYLKIPLSQAFKFNLLYLGGTLDIDSALRWEFIDDLGGGRFILKDPAFHGKWKILGEYGKEVQLFSVEGAFRRIRGWHNEVASKLQSDSYLVTPLGRRRVFWGRLDKDGATLREGVAYGPQSLVADLLNVALCRLHYELGDAGVQVLHQGHDSVLMQIPKERLDALIPKMIECFDNPIEVTSTTGTRTLKIPPEFKAGYSWGELRSVT